MMILTAWLVVFFFFFSYKQKQIYKNYRFFSSFFLSHVVDVLKRILWFPCGRSKYHPLNNSSFPHIKKFIGIIFHPKICWIFDCNLKDQVLIIRNIGKKCLKKNHQSNSFINQKNNEELKKKRLLFEILFIFFNLKSNNNFLITTTSTTPPYISIQISYSHKIQSG